MLDALRQRIGVERPIPYPYNTEARTLPNFQIFDPLGDISLRYCIGNASGQEEWNSPGVRTGTADSD
jgi:hypothetical protein